MKKTCSKGICWVVERHTVKTFHEVHKDQVTATIKDVEVHFKLQVDDTGNSSPSDDEAQISSDPLFLLVGGKLRTND